MMDRIAAQTLAYAALGANLARSRRPWTSVPGALAEVDCGRAGCFVPLRAAVTSWWPIWPSIAVIAILVALAQDGCSHDVNPKTPPTLMREAKQDPLA